MSQHSEDFKETTLRTVSSPSSEDLAKSCRQYAIYSPLLPLLTHLYSKETSRCKCNRTMEPLLQYPCRTAKLPGLRRHSEQLPEPDFTKH